MRFMVSKSSIRFGAAVLALAAAGSCGFKHKKFENPIVADTDQPDKILFDKAVKDIEKGRYEMEFYGHHGGLTPWELEIPLLALAY